MSLYLLERTDRVFYDDFEGYVIRANSIEEARNLAAERTHGKGKNVWLDKEKSRCTIIKLKGVSRVILAIFNEGG